MDTNNEQPQEITYYNCNKDTIILLALIFPSLIFSILVLVFFVYSSVNNKYRVCEPLYFFLGDKTGCSNFIAKTVKSSLSQKTTNNKVVNEYVGLMQNILGIDVDDVLVENAEPPSDNFTPRQSSDDDDPEFYDITYLYKDFKIQLFFPFFHYIKTNYLAMINCIHRFNHWILP